MITYKQKEYANSSDVIRKATEALEKERTYDFEVSDKISKDFISISGNILLETSHLQKNVSSKASSPNTQ